MGPRPALLGGRVHCQYPRDSANTVSISPIGPADTVVRWGRDGLAPGGSAIEQRQQQRQQRRPDRPGRVIGQSLEVSTQHLDSLTHTHTHSGQHHLRPGLLIERVKGETPCKCSYTLGRRNV